MPYTGNVQNAGEADANFDDASVNAPGVATTIDLTDYTVKTISAELTINGDQTLAPNELLVSTETALITVSDTGSLTIGDDINDTSSAIIQTGNRTGLGIGTLRVEGNGSLTTQGRTLLISNNIVLSGNSNINMDSTVLEFAEGSDNKRIRMNSTNARLNNITQTGNGRFDFFVAPVEFSGFNPVNQQLGAAQWIGGTTPYIVADANGAGLTYYGDAHTRARVEFINPVVTDDQLILTHNNDTPGTGNTTRAVTTVWRQAQFNLRPLATATFPTGQTDNIRIYMQDNPQATIPQGAWNDGNTYDGAQRNYWITPDASGTVLFNGTASNASGVITGNDGGRILMKAIAGGLSIAQDGNIAGTYSAETGNPREQLFDRRGNSQDGTYLFDFHIWGLDYQYNTVNRGLYGTAGVHMENVILLDDNLYIDTTFATNDELAARLITDGPTSGPVPGSKWSVDNLSELYSALKQRKVLNNIGAVHGTSLAGNLDITTQYQLPTIGTLYGNAALGNGGLTGLDFGALDVTIQANEANGLTPLTYTPFAPSDTEVTFIAGNDLGVGTAALAADEQFPGGIITTGIIAPRAGSTVTLNTNIEDATIDMAVEVGGVTGFLQLGDISLSNTTVNDITAVNVGQLDGVTFNGNVTVDVSGGVDISTLNLIIPAGSTITFTGTGTLTHSAAQTASLIFNGPTSVEVEAIVTFRNEAHAQGGFLTVIRNTGTDAAPNWVIQTTIVVGSADSEMFTVNDIGDYIVLWRPRTARMATTFFRTTVTSGQVETFTITRTEISETLLFDEALPDRSNVDIAWNRMDIDGDDDVSTADQLELIGTVSNTVGVGDLTPSAGETQRALLGAYANGNYILTIAERIEGITNNDDLILRDIIFPITPSQTGIDGEFVQLDSAGTQQFLTSVLGQDVNGNDVTGTLSARISANITGTDGDGDAISFPAVSLLQNPDGITISDVLGAFANTIAPMQRGVSYTVGALDANPIIQAPRNARYEQADGDVPTGTYPEL